jgi:hypothetical protein
VGRLAKFVDVWEEAGAPPYILDYIREGVKVKKIKHAVFVRDNKVNMEDSRIVSWLDMEVTRLLQIGAIVEEKPDIVSGLKAVEKKLVKTPYRLVINMRPANATLEKPKKFKLESLELVAHFMQHAKYAATFDLAAGYFHLSLHLNLQKVCRFQWREKFYTYKVLPFGLSHSSIAFVKTMKVFVNHLRAMGIMVSNYVDDFILFGDTREEIEKAIAITKIELARFGLVREPDKRQFTPSTKVMYLGYELDLEKGTIVVPENKLDMAVKMIKSLVKDAVRKEVPARRLAKVCGTVISLSKAFGFAKIMLRNSYRCLIPAIKKEDWDMTVVVDVKVQKDLS